MLHEPGCVPNPSLVPDWIVTPPAPVIVEETASDTEVSVEALIGGGAAAVVVIAGGGLMAVFFVLSTLALVIIGIVICAIRKKGKKNLQEIKPDEQTNDFGPTQQDQD